MQSDIKNTFQLALDYQDKMQEYLCSGKNKIYVYGIGIKTHGDMEIFNIISQNVKLALRKIILVILEIFNRW